MLFTYDKLGTYQCIGQKYNARLPKYNACSFFQAEKIELEDLWLFPNELSIHVSSIGIEKTSMLNNKMLDFLRRHDANLEMGR